MKGKKSVLDVLKERRIYLDGAAGTMLQKAGLAPGEAPESWNLSHPEKVTELHRSYLDVGCDMITTNTFGVNRTKHAQWKEMIQAAVECARKAIGDMQDKFIAFDVGPLGVLLEPFGSLPFEEAVSIFADNIREAEKNGVDLILIETMNDSYETKAAVLAAKENCSLPIFVTNVYDATGKLMTGATPETMSATLEGLRVDAIGMNCSLGPNKMLPLVERFTSNCSLPIIAMPNAGLPKVVDGKTVYEMDADEFSDYAVQMAQNGVNILGGCCGTTPEFLKKVIEKTRNIPLNIAPQCEKTVISSYTRTVEIGPRPTLIGERINPTGKPKLKEALRNRNMEYIIAEGLKQVEKGVSVLDVNVGLPEINEQEMLVNCVKELQAVTDLPLQIDTVSTVAIESAMRIYNGKPLVNSVNGKEESMHQVLPLVKKYGGVVIALTLDESGIPSTAEGRVAIAEKIYNCAREYGIAKKDIVVDPLALTISSDPNGAMVTLEAIRELKRRGFKTSLGVSNISFGLPQREIINSTFFATALESGLDCAIMNPFSVGMMNAYMAFCALHGLDTACSEYIAYASAMEQPQGVTVKKAVDASTETLGDCIIKGLSKNAVRIAAELVNSMEPLAIIEKEIIPALNTIGADFEKGKAFLPQLLMSADAASAAFGEIKKAMTSISTTGRKVIIATVKGDIHDIGKNIVKVLLESYGFDVIDLGRDVPAEDVLKTAEESGCLLIGLSALMTTTVPAMEETIKLVHSKMPNAKIIVGGAVLNEEYAKQIRADYYAPDAMSAVRYAESFYAEK